MGVPGGCWLSGRDPTIGHHGGGQAGAAHGRRRPRGVPRGRAGPAQTLRAGPPDCAGRVRAAGPGGAAGDQAARRPGGGAAGRLPHAGDERPGVPGAGHGPVPQRPAGPADRLRRHRRRHRGDQRHRPRPLPAQAVGAAGGEAVPGGGRAACAVGHRWSARSYEVRDFLARNSVSYRWLTADQPEGRRLLEAAGLDEASIPLVVTPDGDSLVDPSVEELAARVGLSTTPATDFYDTVIVGGGPAGLGAAVYAASEGLRTVLVEREATGGQAGQSTRIENYLGFPDGVSGAQLTDRARRQAAKFGAEVLTARDVVALEISGSARIVRFGDGSKIGAHSVVLATGVSYRSLDAPGVAELTGRGVFYGSASTEAPACAGQDVYIVGGANSAGQAAVFFSRHARTVTLLVRGPSLEASMSAYLIKQLEEIDNVAVRTR